MRRDDKYRFSLSWGRDTAEKIAVGDLLEKLKNHKSDLIVQAVWEFIGNHPEVMAENSKIVIAVQSTQTDEQTLAQIQRMIDASMERLKDSMKLQVLQEQHGGQTAPTGPNQQDLDDMLDNLTIFIDHIFHFLIRQFRMQWKRNLIFELFISIWIVLDIES